MSFGPHGRCWTIYGITEKTKTQIRSGSVIVTQSDYPDGEWLHASLAWATRMPTYNEMTVLRDAVFGGRWAIQVFAPPEFHVNIHEHALHLWGKATGERVHPNFGEGGTI
jgi:hypothetical protein